MIRIIGALAVGLLFGAGVSVSGMINPAKVLGFLDFGGNWDPTLGLVMLGALIAAGLLGFLVSVDKISTLVLEVNVLGSQDAGLLTLKLVLLIANFFAAFFNFTLSLRFYNYVALDIGAADQSASQEERKEIVGHLIRAANHYTWGMRGYYLCIPILLWIFGPLWLLAGSVLTTVALYRHDHVAGHRSI